MRRTLLNLIFQFSDSNASGKFEFCSKSMNRLMLSNEGWYIIMCKPWVNTADCGNNVTSIQRCNRTLNIITHLKLKSMLSIKQLIKVLLMLKTLRWNLLLYFEKKSMNIFGRCKYVNRSALYGPILLNSFNHNLLCTKKSISHENEMDMDRFWLHKRT